MVYFFQFFPLLGLWGELGYSEETFSCTILKKNGKSPKTFIFLVGFILPCFIIVLSYSCIFYTVRKQHSKLSQFDTSTTSTKSKLNFFRNKNDLRLTIMMLTIFICFILCFLPLMITNVYDDDTKYPAVHILASILAWSSAVINPIIYAVGSSQYRNAYKNLFVKIKTWKSSVSSGNNNKLQNSIDPDSMQNEKLSTITTKAKSNHVAAPLEIT